MDSVRSGPYASLGVVTLGPVVAGPGLAEDEVVRPEESSVWSAADTVHGAGLQVHQHSPGHVLPPAGLVVVHVDPLQLEVRISTVAASGVDTVLITDDLPELGSNLVTALASLQVDNFSHDEGCRV